MKVTTCSPRPVLEPCGLENIAHQIDTYVGCEHNCHYCYALPEAETDWTCEVQTHPDLIGTLRVELEEIEPQPIYMGYKTDPYQPCEAEQLQTRKALEYLHEKGFSANLLTKSDLFLRDVDVLSAMDAARVSISTAFPDDVVRERFEGRTISTRARIDALRQLQGTGIRTSALICPVIPHITETIALVEELAPVADTIWVYGLILSDRSSVNCRNVLNILKTHYPEQCGEIENALFNREHDYWNELRSQLETVKRASGLNMNIKV